MLQIMPVDRSDIVKSKFLEQRPAHRHAAHELIGLARRLVQRLRQPPRETPRDLAQFQEGPRRHQPRQKIGRATSELQSLMRISHAVYCLTKKTISQTTKPLTRKTP